MRGRRIAAFAAVAALAATALQAADVTVVVPGSANPYLAGLPDGAAASSGDRAPAQSPVEVSGLGITGGMVLTFAATGRVSLGTGLFPDPDGGAPIGHTGRPTNGFSDAIMPRVALLGVFVNDSPSASTIVPPPLDVSGDGLDYRSLAPLPRQIFFIGDGRTSGGAPHEIVVPPGATRLFLGTMDGYGWYNNTGRYEVVVRATPRDTPASPAAGGVREDGPGNGVE